MADEKDKKTLKFSRISSDLKKRLASEEIGDIIEQAVPADIELPKVKFKISDDEFLLLLETIKGKRIPISMLDEILPYKIKRDNNGKFIGLPGGLDERAKRLGIRLSRSTYESPETGELFVQIDCTPMTKEEVDDFIKKRNDRVMRYQSKDSDDLRRIMCSVCNTRVQVGIVSGEIKVYCACDETPFDAVDISSILDVEHIKKWK